MVLVAITFMVGLGRRVYHDLVGRPAVAQAPPKESITPRPPPATVKPEPPRQQVAVPVAATPPPVPAPQPPVVRAPELPRPKEPDWCATRGFTHEYGQALDEWENIQRKEDANALRHEQQVAAAEAKLTTLVTKAQQQSGRVTARAFVVESTPQETRILTDVTAGWLTEVNGDYRTDRPQAGLIWLRPDPGLLKPVLSLRVGQEITAADAAQVEWGDHLTIEFLVRAIGAKRPIPAQKLEFGQPLVVVTIDHLRCVATQGNGRRSTVWGDPGTLPTVFGRSLQLTGKVSEIMSAAVTHATARMRVAEVKNGQIFLYRDLSEFNALPTVLVKRNEKERLTLPVSVIGKEAVAAFTDNTRILVGFTVKEIVPGWWAVNDLSYVNSLNKNAVGVVIDDLRFIQVLNTKGAGEGANTANDGGLSEEE